ncbi:MAG: cytochrome c3 family protein, partial [Phycisphaerales bacterium]
VAGERLPLLDGRITCLTCHDANDSHASGRVPVGIRGGSAAALCLSCHEGAAPGSGGGHATLGVRAHLSQKQERRVPAKNSLVDSESAACMSCHDGASAREAGSHPIRSMNGELMAEHPIGIPLKATERTKHGDFRIAREGSLDPRIRLFDGKLGCGSCHSVYSKHEHLLVMSNQRSRLCLSCHTQ